MTIPRPNNEVDRIRQNILPVVLGMCGYSDSGKTTLMETALAILGA